MAEISAFERPGVRGFLHRPAVPMPGGRGLVLTHGAGGNCTAPLLVKLSELFAGAGFAVLRCDLPFRQRRPSGPPSPSGAAADREGLRLAVAALREIGAKHVTLGGQSYGGRQATMLAAAAPDVAQGLLLLSYPLHPPGKPERLRTEHFPQMRLPCVFVHGSRDPFGTLAEIEAAVAAIPGPVRLIPVDGAGHDLKRGGFDLTPILGAVQAG